jgi:hypothetical protein
MGRIGRIVMAGVAAVSLISQRTEAQGRLGAGAGSTRAVRLAIGGGVSVPTGDYKKVFDNGVNARGSLLFNLGGLPFGLRADLDFNRFTATNTQLVTPQIGIPQQTTLDLEQQMIGGLGNISIPILPVGPIAVYATGGVGAFNLKSTVTGTSTEQPSTSVTKFGFDAGGGISLKLGRIDGFIEGRIQNVYTEKGAIDLKSVKVIPVTFGIIF